MGPARRACDWEQGERVPPRWDLVAAVRVRPDNTRQATNRQLSAFGWMAETDDGRLGADWVTVSHSLQNRGYKPPASALRKTQRGCVWASRPLQNADVAEWQTR